MSVKYRLVFFVVISLGVTAKSNANELDNAAACSGVVLGNAAIDYSLGDKTSFNEGVGIAITAYLSEVLQSSAANADIEIADPTLFLSLNTCDGIILGGVGRQQKVTIMPRHRKK